MKVITVHSHAGRSRLMAASDGDIRRFYGGSAERYVTTDRVAGIVTSMSGVSVLGTSDRLIGARVAGIRERLREGVGNPDALLDEYLFLSRSE